MKGHSKLSKNEPENVLFTKGTQKIKNWFLMESDCWTGKIILFIFVHTNEGWLAKLGQ